MTSLVLVKNLSTFPLAGPVPVAFRKMDGNEGMERFYGPFMKKLGDLSSDYEKEKAALEQIMIRSLHDIQAGKTQF